MNAIKFIIMKYLYFIGDDNSSEGDEDGEEPTPSCGDYIMHFLTLFWKILFAFIPPTGKYRVSSVSLLMLSVTNC